MNLYPTQNKLNLFLLAKSNIITNFDIIELKAGLFCLTMLSFKK